MDWDWPFCSMPNMNTTHGMLQSEEVRNKYQDPMKRKQLTKSLSNKNFGIAKPEPWNQSVSHVNLYPNQSDRKKNKYCLKLDTFTYTHNG